MVCEVARAGRPAGQAEDRTGVDVARAAGAGVLHERTAEDWLRATLAVLDDAASRGADLSVTFAEAAREWLRYVEEDRAVKATIPIVRVLDRALDLALAGQYPGHGFVIALEPKSPAAAR